MHRSALLASALAVLVGGVALAGPAAAAPPAPAPLASAAPAAPAAPAVRAAAAPSKTYTVAQTFGPYNGAATADQPGTIPTNGEGRVVYCTPGDSILSGSATVNRKTSHGTAKSTVITVDVVGAFWDTEDDMLKYGAFVGTTGKPGWNSVTLSITCRRH